MCSKFPAVIGVDGPSDVREDAGMNEAAGGGRNGSGPWRGRAGGLAAILILAALPFLRAGAGPAPPEWAVFIGRFHPVVLHFPIAILVVAALFELSRLPGLRRVIPTPPAPVTSFLLGLGALTGTAAAVMGWMLSQSGGYETALLQRHMILGLGVPAGAILALLAWTGGAMAAGRGLLFATAGLTLAAGHLGGALTHGEDYLTEYAPAPVRRALGLPVRADFAPALLPTGERLAFRDVVRPILADRCIICHNPAKAMGGLRLDAHGAVAAAGASVAGTETAQGPVALLVHRIRLPADDPKHMPPAGKPQPTAGEISILEWWAAAGMPDDRRLDDLKPPAEVMAAVEARIPEVDRVKLAEEAAARTAALESDLATLRTKIPGGIRAIAAGRPAVEFHPGAEPARFGDADLAALAGLGDRLVWLDLSRTSVTPAGLAALTNTPALRRLNLAQTVCDDTAIAALPPLPHLEMLNLTGTRVGADGLARLASRTGLRAVYVWQTRADAASVRALASALTNAVIHAELPTPEP